MARTCGIHLISGYQVMVIDAFEKSGMLEANLPLMSRVQSTID